MSDDLVKPLAALAKKDNVRVTTKATQLLQSAIEREEDELLVSAAEKRRTTAKTWCSHESMMKKHA